MSAYSMKPKLTHAHPPPRNNNIQCKIEPILKDRSTQDILSNKIIWHTM